MMGETVIIDSETGEETTRPLTPAEEAQKAADEAAWAAVDWPKAVEDFEAEWQAINDQLRALNEELAELMTDWGGAADHDRIILLGKSLDLVADAARLVNRKANILSQAVARGIYEEVEYQEEVTP
jgi:acyl-CoA reductase-like NAD-dependent aldehyde dehydrogenase